MQDVLYLDDPAQVAVLVKPAHLEIVQRMDEPTTCTELAGKIGMRVQTVHYHMNALQKAGLVERVDERRVRGIVEGIYQATARSYWMSPRLVGRVGGADKASDRSTLAYLFALAEQVQEDVGRLAGISDDAPSLAMDATVSLRNEAERTAFARDIQSAFEAVARKYGATKAAPKAQFKLALMCYPLASTHGKRRTHRPHARPRSAPT